MKVLFGISQSLDIVFLDEQVEDGWCEIGRQTGSQSNIFHAHGQQGQKDGGRLLFQMTEGQGEGQVIDGTLQGLGQFGGHDNGGIGIVALSHIQDTRQSIGQGGGFEFGIVNNAILGTAQGENEGITRCFFGQRGKVGPIPLTAIATANQKDARQGPGLRRFNHLVRQGHDGPMIKARRMKGGGFNGTGKALELLGLLNDGRKVLVRSNMLDPIDTDFIHGIQAILVHATGFQNTIGRDDNGTGKGGKFKLLILPGRAIIAGQMRILSQFGIGMGW